MKYMETIKTIMIAVLITGIIAFVAGMHWANSQNTKTQSAVRQATSK